MSLFDEIKAYADKGLYPFHMPGHKRNAQFDSMNGLFAFDLTEVDGTDDLHAPEGILKQAQQRAAALYGCDDAYFLVNGSTAGILTAVSAAVPSGGEIIVARNCHKSVFNAVFLRNLEPHYVYPSFVDTYGINGSVQVCDVENVLKQHPQAKAVVITSPTYEGVVSDIKSIADVVHAHAAVLIVDSAHGAHHGFSAFFPAQAVHLGADAVVVSLHKTLPSPTGTALLLCNGNGISRSAVRRYLDCYETSSPSYLFMIAEDACIGLLRDQQQELFAAFENKLRDFDRKMQELQTLRVFCMGNDSPENHPHIFAHDKSRIVVSTIACNLDGFELAGILRERFCIEAEMAFGEYAVLLTSICDTQEGFDRLADALLTVDKECKTVQKQVPCACPIAEKAMKPSQAELKNGGFVLLDDAVGTVCHEYVCAYPPGTPVLIPGETVSPQMIAFLNNAVSQGAKITGSGGQMPEKIEVIAH
ncbi:MAG: aminotransferase class V-fold PLP-dependent enzyme [Clostridia bacterium]|nr:aminotransferase class V-fold PLP-dependent enzyme [Clostridia bacterium]